MIYLPSMLLHVFVSVVMGAPMHDAPFIGACSMLRRPGIEPGYPMSAGLQPALRPSAAHASKNDARSSGPGVGARAPASEPPCLESNQDNRLRRPMPAIRQDREPALPRTAARQMCARERDRTALAGSTIRSPHQMRTRARRGGRPLAAALHHMNCQTSMAHLCADLREAKRVPVQRDCAKPAVQMRKAASAS